MPHKYTDSLIQKTLDAFQNEAARRDIIADIVGGYLIQSEDLPKLIADIIIKIDELERK